MSNIENLRAELRDTLAAARAIAAKAESEGRDFTDTELTQVKPLVDRAAQLGAQVKAAKATSNREAFDSFVTKVGGGGEHHTPMQSKAAALGYGPSDSWGDRVTGRHEARMGTKAINPSGAVLVPVPVRSEPVRLSEPVLALRQLLTTVPNTSGRFAYLQQTVRTSNAAPVAHGALKPTSVYSLVRQDDDVSTIAHLSEPIARQDLADAALLTDFIDQEMRLGLEAALENQILNGSGVGANLTGFNTTSGIQAQAFQTGNLMLTLRRAVTTLDNSNLSGSMAWVMSPASWESIEMGATAAFPNSPISQTVPVDRSARRLWGAPVAVSTSVAANVAWLFDTGSVRLHLREEAVLDWSQDTWDPNGLGAGVGATDFSRNMIRFRCEGRFGLEVSRPAGIVKVALA